MRIVKGKGFSDLFKNLTQPITEKFEQTKKTFNALAFGISDYNAQFRKILEQYGDDPIKSIKVCRSPVSSAVKAALNVISLGAFQKRLERQNYDDVFHLFAIITLEDDTILTLDKQAILTLKVGDKAYKDAINVNPPFTTLNEMLNNTKKEMGPDAFFGYNAKTNNCQGFLWKFLKSNGKTNPELRSFIMQDVNQLFDEDLEGISKFVTDLGSKFSTIRYGGDLNKSC